jgi:hypothetical protein
MDMKNMFNFNKSTTSSDQSEIDKKKNITAAFTTIDWFGFFKNIFSFIFQLIIVFIIGSRIVIACKYAQSNFLPTNSGCKPYTDVEPEFKSTEPMFNIDRVSVYDKKTNTSKKYAKTIMFPFTEDTTKNYFIDTLKKMGNKYDTSGVKKYAIEVVTNMFSWNFFLISSVLGILNWLPFETLIILLGPYLLRYYAVFGITLLGFIITFIACLFNVGWLFKKNANNEAGESVDKDGPPKWEKIDVLSDLFEFLGVIFNLIVGWIIFLMFMILPVHACVFIICFITPFMKSAKIIIDPNDPNSKQKDYTFFQSIKGLFETKIDIFMILVCINTVLSAKKFTNNTATVFIFIACLVFLFWSYTRPKSIPQYSTTFEASTSTNGKKCETSSHSEEDNIEQLPPPPPPPQGEGEGEGEQPPPPQGEGEGEQPPPATEGEGEGEQPPLQGEGEGEQPPPQGEGEGEQPPTQGEGEGEQPPPATEGEGEGEQLPPATQGEGEGEQPPSATQGEGEGEQPPPATQGEGQGEQPPSTAEGEGQGKQPPPEGQEEISPLTAESEANKPVTEENKEPKQIQQKGGRINLFDKRKALLEQKMNMLTKTMKRR